VGPAERAVSLEMVKAHLNLSPLPGFHDEKLLDIVDNAVERVEHDCEKVLITQTFEIRLFGFPVGDGIAIDRNPIQSIESITYLDTDGDRQTLDPAEYQIDMSRRAVFPAPGKAWPAAFYDPSSVVVTFKAGFGDLMDTVPRNYIEAALLLCSVDFYNDEVALKQYENKVAPLKRTNYP
jgi:uncharacterized phiE125 gp8 family phage protein